MAKTKRLTPEEKLKQEREQERELERREIERVIGFVNEPSYSFQIGEKVQVGAFNESVVEEILYDGKAYGLRCVVTRNNYGQPFDVEMYRIVPWMDIRPLTMGDTTFTTNRDINLTFNNCTIESLLHKVYHFGVDFCPDYQRDYVWEQSDKELLLDSIFKNIEIGKFAFIRLSDSDWLEKNIAYEILDGKQRLSTLIEFYENKLSYKGKYFNDLSKADRRTFLQHVTELAEVSDADKKTVLRYFLLLNRAGKTMDAKHLDAVEDMLNKIDKNN